MLDTNGLVFISHGSKNEEANRHILNIVSQLKLVCRDRYSFINTGFLEFTQPTIESAILEHVQRGVKNITLFLFFLVPGHHVQRDIPDIIKRIKMENPRVIFSILPAFGCAENIIEWIVSLI